MTHRLNINAEFFIEVRDRTNGERIKMLTTRHPSAVLSQYKHQDPETYYDHSYYSYVVYTKQIGWFEQDKYLKDVCFTILYGILVSIPYLMILAIIYMK